MDDELETPEQPDLQAQIDALKAQNAELLGETKKAKFQARYTTLSSKYPFVEQADVEGFDGPAFEKLDTILAKTGQAPAQAPAAEAATPPEAPAPVVTDQEKAALGKFTEGTGTAPVEGNKLPSSTEALAFVQQGAWTDAKYRDYVETKRKRST